MTDLTVGQGLAGMFVPLPSLPHWTRDMGLAEKAYREGDLAQAEGLYVCALAFLSQVMVAGDPAKAQDCLEALVSSCRCLWDLRCDQAQPHGAAETLAQAHGILIGLLLQHPKGSVWHEAAAWHSRETHHCLIEHWQEHGTDPAIEMALRRACVRLQTPNMNFH